MARSTLWASTENDLGNDVAELETTPEEGEAAAIQAETEPDVAAVDENIDQLETGAEAEGQLEEVQGLLETAAADGEGLDPVAAEAVALTLRAIASNLGANPTTLLRLCATENFTPATAKQNTTYAAEGVQEFLKDLAAKIKAALQNLWNKVKGLWSKHVSNAGRLVKALESMKAKVKASSGKIDGKPYMDKIPGSLAGMFKGQGDLSIKEVESYLPPADAFSGMAGKLDGFIAHLDAVAASADKDATKARNALDSALTAMAFQPVELNVIGGEKITITLNDDSEEGSSTVDFQREPIEGKDDSRGMPIADKAALVALLDHAIKVAKSHVKLQADSAKLQQKTNTIFAKLEKLVANGVSRDTEKQLKEHLGLSDEGASVVRKTMRVLYKASATNARIDSLFVRETARSCKAVLAYASVCVKQYK